MRLKFNKFGIAFLLICLANQPSHAQTPDQIADFAKAAKFDNASEVNLLLKKGLNPNSLDANGSPMLILAIRDKSTNVIDLLLSNKNIDVDLSNKSGETPLMMASIEGNLPLVKTIVLGHKARLDHIGWTPLHYACAKGHLDVAQFLVANGAIVDSLSVGNTTPLMMAVQSGNEQLVKFLLDKGADLQLKNANGFTAIDIADIYDKPWIGDGLRSRWLKLYKQAYKGPLKPPTVKSP
ncbi:ankyrin repeat domain-containing protein [Polynucleobacter sp. MWH-Berg-3C6]|uniref:ankyrin repeat domain-containing protein n=1 Tax=Polynucleobacter sp. MWH-Berg-3C6 TaxID=1855882 RepID=UPI001C0ABED0|nr:ankyrin repeat domain-containing protein [Polynucleobacter sp. MWH-Berg-3C6]MBU3550538.1 ankyrin repeat domain-containing protein [Polynucleobacter sp. MWH-Berg-3C6]